MSFDPVAVTKCRENSLTTTVNGVTHTYANDDVGIALGEAGVTPLEACAVADVLVPLLDGSTHSDRYSHVNWGMKRMNAGNRIRGGIRRTKNPVSKKALNSAVADVLRERDSFRIENIGLRAENAALRRQVALLEFRAISFNSPRLSAGVER